MEHNTDISLLSFLISPGSKVPLFEKHCVT